MKDTQKPANMEKWEKPSRQRGLHTQKHRQEDEGKSRDGFKKSAMLEREVDGAEGLEKHQSLKGQWTMIRF